MSAPFDIEDLDDLENLESLQTIRLKIDVAKSSAEKVLFRAFQLFSGSPCCLYLCFCHVGANFMV